MRDFRFVRIDRNTGRAILICHALWLYIQKKAPPLNSRHRILDVLLSSNNDEYTTRTIAEFQKIYVLRSPWWQGLSQEIVGSNATWWMLDYKREQSFFSYTSDHQVSAYHCSQCSPTVLRRFGPALSLLVSLAVAAVRE